tara:strand:+ start:443 stop:730 length:288 start_codon:yes stop_codon:yes gene_type:complete
MNEEHQLSTELQRGVKAKLLLEDPLLTEAFQTLEDEYLSAWKQSSVEATEQREKIWLMYATISEVKAQLTTVVTTGDMAKAQLEALQKRKKNGIF